MKRFVIIALTAGGAKTARQLQEHLQEQSYHTEVVLPQRLAQGKENYYPKGEFTATMHRRFNQYECDSCIMATGIVVRSLAAVIVDKTVAPAVIVMDEQATSVISLLS